MSFGPLHQQNFALGRASIGTGWEALLPAVLTGIAFVVAGIAVTLDASRSACAVVSLVLTTAHLGCGIWAVRRFTDKVDAGWALLLCAMFFWFLVPAMVRTMGNDWTAQGAAIRANESSFVLALFGVAAFAFSAQLGYLLRPPRGLFEATLALTGNRVKLNHSRSFWFFVLALCSCYAFYVGISGGIGPFLENILAARTVDKPWAANGNFGTSVTPFHYFASGTILALTLVFGDCFFRRKCEGHLRLIAGILWLTGCVTLTTDSGTRSALLLAAMGPIVLAVRTIWEKKRNRGGQRNGGSGRTVVAAIGILLAATVFADFIRDYRYKGSREGTGDIRLQIDDNDFLMHAAMAQEVWRAEDFRITMDSPFIHIITGPIPRVLWPDKPAPSVVRVFSMYVWGFDVWRTGGNTIPSIVGQYLLSWGWYGVFEIGFVLGFWLRLADTVFRRATGDYPLYFATLFGLWVFASFRFIGFFYFFPQCAMLLILLTHRGLGVLNAIFYRRNGWPRVHHLDSKEL